MFEVPEQQIDVPRDGFERPMTSFFFVECQKRLSCGIFDGYRKCSWLLLHSTKLKMGGLELSYAFK